VFLCHNITATPIYYRFSSINLQLESIFVLPKVYELCSCVIVLRYCYMFIHYRIWMKWTNSNPFHESSSNSVWLCKRVGNELGWNGSYTYVHLFHVHHGWFAGWGIKYLFPFCFTNDGSMIQNFEYCSIVKINWCYWYFNIYNYFKIYFSEQ